MTLRLKNATPAIDQLKPAPTEVELRWFRNKRLKAIGRSLLLAGGAGVLWLVGSLLRDATRSHQGRYLFELGLVGLMQLAFIVNAIRSVNLVKDIQSRRDSMKEDQRKRIFLSALDDDVP